MAFIVLCPTPKLECTGSVKKMEAGLGLIKSHPTHEECFNCYKRYLRKLGFQRLGPREYALDDGPVVVLTKRSRIGAQLRAGKEGRFMPKNRLGGCCIG